VKLLPTYQKLRGGYYTPDAIAHFLSKWAIRRPDDRILEPSCGNGTFLQAAAERLRSLGAPSAQIARAIVGFEIDVLEAAKAVSRLKPLGVGLKQARIYPLDFFSEKAQVAASGEFDAVLGNPPFIRYQNFPEEQRDRALELMRDVGCTRID